MANLSSSFIRPLVDIPKKEVYSSSFKDTYMAAEGYNCEYGKCMFLHYRAPVSDNLDSTLRTSPLYESTYTPDERNVLYVFRLKEEDYKTVVKPFIEGKYSEVSKDFVEKYFPSEPTSPLYGNRLVFDKSQRWIDYWSERGVEVPEGAEVWNRPLEQKETYYGSKTEDIEMA